MKKIVNLLRYITTAIFLLTAFFYFLLFIDPSLIDFKQQPLFLLDHNFLSQFLVYPGGFTEYINLFITQFFVSKFTGSVLIIILVGIFIFLSNRIIKKYYTGNTLWLISFIPGLLLISLHSNYSIDLATDIVILLVLLFTWLFQKIRDQKIQIKVPVLILSSLLLYYFFGGTALFTYSVIVIATEVVGFKKNEWYFIPIVIIVAILLPWLTSINSAYLDFKKAMVGIIEISKVNKPVMLLQIFILCSLPLFIFLSPVGNLLYSKIKIKTLFSKIIDFTVPIVLITIMVLVMFFSFNQGGKNTLLLNYTAKNRNWDEVLKTADKLSLDDRKVLFQVNRALYHQGRLADEAFSYSQLWGEHGLILTTYYNSEVLMYCSDLFYDMGHIKGALHWAYEAQTKFDKSPDVLKRIALCNLLLGQYSASEKFLTILSKSPIHKKWAKKYIPYLNNQNLISADPELSEKQKLIPLEDFYSNTQHPQYDLYMLLTQHPENKMAFEYFMIDALLTHDLAKVVVNLKYLEKLGYEKIPVHIEEALMMFLTMNKDYKVDLGKYQISKSTRDNFIGYSKLLMKYRQNRKEGQPEIYRNFGNTYWYYIHFVSPITTKRVFQEK